MRKRGCILKGHVSTSGMTLREEKSGRKLNKGSSVSVKSKLKLEHLQSLALWAGREPSVASLAAFFGYRFAECREANGIPSDPSLFPCQRCETLLQPGYNCTVRIVKNKSESCKCNKRNAPVQNNVVYRCNFCLHRNMKRGTPNGHMKDICPPKPQLRVESSGDYLRIHQSTVMASCSENEVNINPVVEIASPAMPGDDVSTANTPAIHDFVDPGSCRAKEIEVNDVIDLASPARNPMDNDDGPVTLLVTPHTTFLEGKKRKRSKSGSKKVTESESNSAKLDAEKDTGASSKRKRKSWTSLKEIAHSTDRSSKQKIPGLSFPFLL